MQATINNVNAGYAEPIVDVNFVRSRHQETLLAALTTQPAGDAHSVGITPSSVLHVMAHGDHSESPAFCSSGGQTVTTVETLAALLLDKWGLEASTIVADGCRTGIGVWQKAIRDCLTRLVTYVGTSAQVGWHEGTVFASAFYGALTRNKGSRTFAGGTAHGRSR